MLGNILQATIFLPLIFAVATVFFKKKFLYIAVPISFFIFAVYSALLLKELLPMEGLRGKIETEPHHWLGIWDIKASFLVDDLNLPFLWVVSFTFLLVFLIGRLKLDSPRATALLLLEGFLLGLYASSNLFLLLFFFGLTILPSAFLIGFDGSMETKKMTNRFMCMGAVCVFFLIFCFFGTYPGFKDELDTLFLGNLLFFREILFFLLSLSFLIWTAISPFQWRLSGALSAKNLILLLPLITVCNFGFYAFFRFLLTTFSDIFLKYNHFFIFLGLLSVFRALVFLLKKRQLKDKVILLQQLFSGIVLLGLSCVNKDGLTGALMVNLFSFVAMAAIFIILEIGNRSGESLDLNKIKNNPKFALFFSYVVLGAFLLPVSFGFHSALLVFGGLEKIIQGLVFIIAIGLLPLLLIACYNALLLRLEFVNKNTSWNRSVFFIDTACYIFVGLVLVSLTFYPGLISQYFTKAVDGALSNWSGV